MLGAWFTYTVVNGIYNYHSDTFLKRLAIDEWTHNKNMHRVNS